MLRLPQARFSNVYGPAEVNQCTYYHLPQAPEENGEPVPLGRIWDNAEGLIIDEQDGEVPRGEIGELVVRTPTMMRGYWARPDLNARAFYRRPVFGEYEDIFYRTGDLVQLHPDGQLRFLGRKDRQVKTRGYRVELDEIENALSGHPYIEENAVFALPDAEGSAVIQAAVILRSGAPCTETELKAHLAGLVPWYAVPVKIAIRSDFPRTTSGKIDRRTLREQALAAAGDPETQG